MCGVRVCVGVLCDVAAERVHVGERHELGSARAAPLLREAERVNLDRLDRGGAAAEYLAELEADRRVEILGDCQIVGGPVGRRCEAVDQLQDVDCSAKWDGAGAPVNRVGCGRSLSLSGR